MRLYLLLLFLLSNFFTTAQSMHQSDVQKFQDELNAEYRDPKKSPLEAKSRKKFKGHDFFPIDSAYRVVATLVPTENAPLIKMPTTGDRLVPYKKYADLTFSFKGNNYSIPVYQSYDLMRMPGYRDYLFLPFTDLTNGNSTYEGGRYLELRLPKSGNTIVVDFNKAYNPYCAYNLTYACPIVPAENHLAFPVEAGVRYLKKKK
ncbi:MAG: DUF1684 domain-containing protein [Cytophagia bacterium]|nr:DUF1684 domain-containing protein [Cytophagia bacterium]